MVHSATLWRSRSLNKYLPWVEARRRYHLSDAHIQMAWVLRLNPKKFGGLANTKQESWKLPLPEYIEELYFKHFKKIRPENVRSIEQVVSDSNRKKAERRARKQTAPQSQPPDEDPLRQQRRRPSRCTVYASADFLSSLVPRPHLPPMSMTSCHAHGRSLSAATRGRRAPLSR